ncbi:hypothetical protein METH109765_17385 [Mesobacillus thioparans]
MKKISQVGENIMISGAKQLLGEKKNCLSAVSVTVIGFVRIFDQSALRCLPQKDRLLQ